MKHDAEAMLVIIDMIKGFISEGMMSDPTIAKVTPTIIKQIESFIKLDAPILAFKDCHQNDSLEFNSYPVHCLKGTSESELIEELIPYEKHMIVLEKETTNAFIHPQFLDILAQVPNLKKIVICGCCTDICVLQFALCLKTYLIQQKSKIECIVLKEGVDTFNAPNHNKEEFNEFALTLMRNAAIVIE